MSEKPDSMMSAIRKMTNSKITTHSIQSEFARAALEALAERSNHQTQPQIRMLVEHYSTRYSPAVRVLRIDELYSRSLLTVAEIGRLVLFGKVEIVKDDKVVETYTLRGISALGQDRR